MGDENQYHASQTAKGGKSQSRAVSISDTLAALHPRSAGRHSTPALGDMKDQWAGSVACQQGCNILSFGKSLHERPEGGCRAVIRIDNDIDNQ
jgi:hypothetical protein